MPAPWPVIPLLNSSRFECESGHNSEDFLENAKKPGFEGQEVNIRTRFYHKCLTDKVGTAPAARGIINPIPPFVESSHL